MLTTELVHFVLTDACPDLRINEKLHVDAVMYPTEVDRVSYALGEVTQPIFQPIDSWVRANEDTMTMKELSHEIEHYMGIPMLAATAKRDLITIMMKGGEKVNEYYRLGHLPLLLAKRMQSAVVNTDQGVVNWSAKDLLITIINLSFWDVVYDVETAKNR